MSPPRAGRLKRDRWIMGENTLSSPPIRKQDECYVETSEVLMTLVCRRCTEDHEHSFCHPIAK